MGRPIKNYLPKLTEISSEIYPCTEEGFLENTVFKDLSRAEKQSLAKEIGVSERLMYYYSTGKKKCSLKNLLILAEKRRLHKFPDQLYQNIVAYKTWGHCGSTYLPKKFSPELAYLVGFIAGDGHVSKRSEVRAWNDSKKIIKEIIPRHVRSVFKLKTQTFKNKGCYTVMINSKPAHSFLSHVIGLPVGKKKGRLEIPEFIFKSKTYKLNFLKGLFDSDGGVTVHKDGKASILYSSSTKKFLLQVRDLLKEFSVELGGPYQSGNKKGLEIRSFAKGQIINFFNEIDCYHPKKKTRIQAIVAQRQSTCLV